MQQRLQASSALPPWKRKKEEVKNAQKEEAGEKKVTDEAATWLIEVNFE